MVWICRWNILNMIKLLRMKIMDNFINRLMRITSNKDYRIMSNWMKRGIVKILTLMEKMISRGMKRVIYNGI